MITIVYGNEPYLIDREKQSVLSGLYVPEMNYLKSDKFDKDTITFLNTYPMMPDTKRQAFLDIDKMSVLDTEEFREYLEEPVKTSDLFILIREYDGRTKFGKFLKESGYLKACNKLSSNEDVQKVILYELKKTGARITADAMAELLKRENYLDSEDVTLLSIISDIHAVCVIDKDITLPVIQTYIQSHEVADRFALAKMIQSNDIASLVKQTMLLSKDDLIGTLALLLREYRIAWKNNFAKLQSVKYVTFKGMNIHDSLKAMGILQDAIDSIKSGGAIEESMMRKVFIDLCEIGGAA